MSGYRERRDPREVAFELLQEAYAKEAEALSAKHCAEIDLKVAEAERERAWQMLGARTNLVRHLSALEKAASNARTRAPVTSDPGRLAELEAERVRFLRERGVDPGPAPTEVTDLGQVRAELEKAKAAVAECEAEIRRADETIAERRSALELAIEKLTEATRARVEADSEAKRL